MRIEKKLNIVFDFSYDLIICAALFGPKQNHFFNYLLLIKFSVCPCYDT